VHLFHCCTLTVILRNRENGISKQQTKQIRSQASHIRQGLQALMSSLMQSAHFYKIFVMKKIGKVGIEVLSIGKPADENYISRYLLSLYCVLWKYAN
jgi:predicted transcriptional regulator